MDREAKHTDVLNDIVSERILNQSESVGSDMGNELRTLFTRGMVNAALQDAAPMAVGANNDAV